MILLDAGGKPIALPHWFVFVDAEGGIGGCGYTSDPSIDNQPVPEGHRRVNVSNDEYLMVQIAPKEYRLDDILDERGIRRYSLVTRKQELTLKASAYKVPMGTPVGLSWEGATRPVRIWANHALLDGEYLSPEQFPMPDVPGPVVIWIEDPWHLSNEVTVNAYDPNAKVEG